MTLQLLKEESINHFEALILSIRQFCFLNSEFSVFVTQKWHIKMLMTISRWTEMTTHPVQVDLVRTAGSICELLGLKLRWAHTLCQCQCGYIKRKKDVHATHCELKWAHRKNVAKTDIRRLIEQKRIWPRYLSTNLSILPYRPLLTLSPVTTAHPNENKKDNSVICHFEENQTVWGEVIIRGVCYVCIQYIHLFKQMSGGKNMGVMSAWMWRKKSFDNSRSFLSTPLLNVLVSSSASEFSCLHYMCVSLYIHTTQGLCVFSAEDHIEHKVSSLNACCPNYHFSETTVAKKLSFSSRTLCIWGVTMCGNHNRKQESWKKWKCKMHQVKNINTQKTHMTKMPVRQPDKAVCGKY